MSTLRAGTAVVVSLLVVLAAASTAQAARVTSLQPWKATNTYRAEADIDGRSQPKLEPRTRTNAVRKGRWVRISCQVRGQAAFGSTLWSKVGAYYVPDALLMTYSDGPLRGVPTCRTRTAPPQAPPSSSGGKCTTYTIYGVRGSGESFDGNHGMGATAGPAADSAKAAIERGSVQLRGIDYPAVPITTIATKPTVFYDSVLVGKVVLRKAILRRIKACPRTRIGLVGYSQGASVVGDALRSLPRRAFRRVRSALLIADPYSAGDTDYATTFNYLHPDQKVERKNHGYFDDRRLPRALKSKFDLCFSDDLVCNRAPSDSGVIGQAVLNVHTAYKSWTVPYVGRTPASFGGLLLGRTVDD